MSETFEQQALRISADVSGSDEFELDFARALAAEWFRGPVGWHCKGEHSECISMNAPSPTTDSVTPLYRKPEGL